MTIFSDIKKPYIIAEIASAHYGNPNNVIKLVNESISAKSDAVKLQIFKVSNFVSKYNTNFNELKQIEIDYTNWLIIFKKLSKKKISFIAEIFDYESLLFAVNTNFFIAYKISAACVYDINIINYLCKKKLPTIIAIGGLDLVSVSKIFNKFKKNNLDFCLMFGHQNFPTKIEDLNLNKIKYLYNKYNITIGYADHVDAEDFKYSFSIPLIAYTLGAKIIEKHININRSLKKSDYYSSLDPNEFKEFVYFMKNGINAFGNNRYEITKSEINYNKFSKKYLVAANDIDSGVKLTIKNVDFKRTNSIGITEYKFNKFLKNQIINKNIKKDKMILLKDIL